MVRDWIASRLIRIQRFFSTRQDLDNLSGSMKTLAQQNVMLARLVGDLSGRLNYYEKGPLRESREEYVNNLEVGILVDQGLVKLPKGNGHAR